MLYLKKIKSQLILLIILSSLDILSRIGLIPTPVEFTSILKSLFEEYGLFSVAIISFAENIVGVNSYFPGSVVILVAMSLTTGNLKMATLTFISIYLPSIFSHHVNYFIGVIDKNKKDNSDVINRDVKISHKSNGFFNWRLISFYFTTFWHPHFTALSCLASGKENVSYRSFIANFLIVSFTWNLFWGITMYNIGNIGNTNTSLLPLMYSYLIIWSSWDIYKTVTKNKQLKTKG